jgi:YD repeat-containing protein
MAGNGLVTSRQFDIAGRLTQQTTGQGTSQGSTPLLSQRYRYGVGPRIRAIEQEGPLSSAPSGLQKTSYRYQGFGRLVQDNAPSAPAPAPVQRDSQGRTVQDALHRYTYTEAGQLQSISDHQDRTIASYRYNSLGQRVARPCTRATGKRTATTCGRKAGWLRKWMVKDASPASTCT